MTRAKALIKEKDSIFMDLPVVYVVIFTSPAPILIWEAIDFEELFSAKAGHPSKVPCIGQPARRNRAQSFIQLIHISALNLRAQDPNIINNTFASNDCLKWYILVWNVWLKALDSQ